MLMQMVLIMHQLVRQFNSLVMLKMEIHLMSIIGILVMAIHLRSKIQHIVMRIMEIIQLFYL